MDEIAVSTIVNESICNYSSSFSSYYAMIGSPLLEWDLCNLSCGCLTLFALELKGKRDNKWRRERRKRSKWDWRRERWSIMHYWIDYRSDCEDQGKKCRILRLSWRISYELFKMQHTGIFLAGAMAWRALANEPAFSQRIATGSKIDGAQRHGPMKEWITIVSDSILIFALSFSNWASNAVKFNFRTLFYFSQMILGSFLQHFSPESAGHWALTIFWVSMR